jgi:hypothetical protein
MYGRMPKTDVVDRVQEIIKSKQLDPTMQLQLIENTTTIGKGRKPLTIERISPLDNG